MLSEIHIKNYRCFRDARLTLGAFTVLVGPNGSGKSTLLTVLRGHYAASENVTFQQQAVQVLLDFRYTDGGSARATFEHSTNWRQEGPRGLPKALLLRLELEKLRQANQLQHAPQLAPDGSNLANVVSSISRRSQEELSREFCRWIPLYSDVDLVPTAKGEHQLRFRDRWNEGVWYSPAEVSDGTMLVAAFLSLRYQEKPVDLLLVEEPERGLHPYLVDQLIRFLRSLAEPPEGKRAIQVVLATHSAELLNYVEPAEVRFLSRDMTDGATRIESAPVDAKDWAEYFRSYDDSLRGAWLSGGLGGVPPTPAPPSDDRE